MGVGMNVIATEIEGVVIIEPQVFQDPRGCFLETYNDNRFKAAGLSKIISPFPLKAL